MTDDLINKDFECRKCGRPVVCAVEDGVDVLPICPVCRLTPEQLEAFERNMAKDYEEYKERASEEGFGVSEISAKQLPQQLSIDCHVTTHSPQERNFWYEIPLSPTFGVPRIGERITAKSPKDNLDRLYTVVRVEWDEHGVPTLFAKEA